MRVSDPDWRATMATAEALREKLERDLQRVTDFVALLREHPPSPESGADTTRSRPEVPPPTNEPTRRKPGRPPAGASNGVPTHQDIASEALGALGGEAHVDQIIEWAVRTYGVRPDKAGLVSRLSRTSKTGRKFRRVPGRPNTFALVQEKGAEVLVETGKEGQQEAH